MKRLIISLLVYGTASGAAYVAAGLAHRFSGHGIFAILKDAYQVRWMAVYLLDVAPIFLLCLVGVAALWRVAAKREPVGAGRFLGAALAAAALATLVHGPLFPTSARAMVVLALFVIFFAAAYGVAEAALGKWRPGWPGPFPACGAAKGLVVVAAAVAVVYVGGFQLALRSGAIAENETYRAARERPPAAAQSDAAAALFVPVETVIDGRDFGTGVVVDFDGDGDFDVVINGTDGRLRLWLNSGGLFEEKPDMLPGLDNPVGVFAFADVNGNGLPDLLISEPVGRTESAFENAFLKYVYWYPWPKPAARARLLHQLSPGRWEDVTQKAFPGGVPWGYRKVEPILWLDANADGRLDFVWSGYPHPRASMNRLYLQQADGSFRDHIGDLLDWAPGRIYPEGSDIGDIDGDGDIDMFAYGFPFLNEGGTYRQVCGARLAGIPCDAEARLDEGATFEDVDGDGTLDMVLSYHGTDGVVPKFRLQLFRWQDGGFRRDPAAGSLFYGVHAYLRGKDMDGDGAAEILTRAPSRLLDFRDGQWRDLFAAIADKAGGKHEVIGWIDADGDGDWDLLTRRENGRVVLFDNQRNPALVARITARGPLGLDNQAGATVTLATPTGVVRRAALRSIGGYFGQTDPAILVGLSPDTAYHLRACFASIAGPVGAAAIPADGVVLAITGASGNCVDYRLRVATRRGLLDIQLIAGAEGARLSWRR